MGWREPDLHEGAAVDIQREVSTPSMRRVLLHNDDYTTMDFVVQILVTIFRKPGMEAIQIMLNVHHHGVGVCGVYPAEVAETKVAQVHAAATEAGFPLRASVEPA